MTRIHAVRFALVLVLGTACAFACRTSGEASSWAAGPGADMARAANAFLDGLTPELRKKAVFDLGDDERINWHYVPKTGQRKGAVFKEMTPAQIDLARKLVRAGLTDAGYKKALDVIALEQVLFELEGRDHRDTSLYYVSIFGKPSAKNAWGWRFEGHHLSVNVTVIGPNDVSVAPAFYGANPHDHKGNRPLGPEEDLGRALVMSLDAAQRKQAIVADQSPKEIATKADKKVSPMAPEGIAYGALNAAQVKALKKLIREYLDNSRPEAAEGVLARIAAKGWDKVRFAWAGPTDKGTAHYYKVQGPTFLIEYVNFQNKANHSHTVFRDLENDFGEDLLKAHLEKNPH